MSKTNNPQPHRLQYVSDLHLEFPQNRQWIAEHPLEVTGDILLVAGDTAYLDLPDSDCDTYSQYDFWDWSSQHYKEVIVCFGNHDFYGHYDLSSMPDGYRKQIRHNVHAHYNDVVHVDDIDIIVSTLWSKIEPYNAFLTERNVSDFYRIMYGDHRLTADDFNREHERCLAFIKQAVAESNAITFLHNFAQRKSFRSVPTTAPSRWSWATTSLIAVSPTGSTDTRTAISTRKSATPVSCPINWVTPPSGSTRQTDSTIPR